MQASIDRVNFNRLIEATRRFVRADSNNAALRYIRIDFSKEDSTATASAVDGFRLSVETCICNDVDSDFTVYVKPNASKCPKSIGCVLVEKLEDAATIRYGDVGISYKQPKGDPFDYQKALRDMATTEARYKIGFNGDYLISALQSAKAGLGEAFKNPIVLEFRSPTEPILLNTGKGNVKVVLPVRIKS